MPRSRIPSRTLIAVALAPAFVLTSAQGPPLIWSNLYDGGAGQHDEGIAVLFAADGHLVVGGVRTTAGGRSQILIRKLDRHNGSTLWTHVSSDPLGNDLFLTDMVLDHRGDLLVAGYLSSCAG